MWRYSETGSVETRERVGECSCTRYSLPRFLVSSLLALCSMLLALCYPLASAQVEEGLDPSRIVREKAGVAEIEVSSVKIEDADNPDADADKQGRNAGEERFRRLREGMSPNEVRDGQPAWRQGGRLSPEARRMMREIMEKENISAQELRGNPELGRELREKAERALSERGEDSQPGGGPAEAPQRRRRGSAERDLADEELRRYMDAVVENNLFLPLGSGGEERETSFALTAVISNTSDESDSKAIIEERGGSESYYVSEGDTFADEIEVVDIDEQIVKLDRSGKEEELKLGEGTESRGRRGRRGGGRPGAEGERRPGGEREGSEGDSRPGGESDDFDPSRIPPRIRRMLEERDISIDELRRNPELREELRREFEGSFRLEVRPLEGGRRAPDRVRRIRRID
jgi:hypothetical protein